MHCDTCETTLRAKAPAKINLVLRVHGRRADGYHSLTSLVTGIELCDEMTFAPARRAGIHLVCDDPTLAVGCGNLVTRAARLLTEHAAEPCGVRIELRKQIPIAAGLGGGSSDCATTLAVLNRFWNTGLTDKKIAELGAQLGSDVPLFFAMPAAVVAGRGEQVKPVRLDWCGWVVLAFGGWAVSTPEVYANWREEDHTQSDCNALERVASCQSASEMGHLLVNELELAVYRTVPEVRDFHQNLAGHTGHPWRISGAGSTAFALFDRQSEAQRVGEAIQKAELATRVVVTRNLSYR
ncbi:MAG: 4-(cytidine 5'-diphospho)-2-C-methyl-D-erythritol kinase [Phycisphaerae bacterium]|nr:4-(cytidine 5'-diphospho)-2-C-methyl-D-erythritol kinase [Phycisphaerae bacterium]